VGRLEDAGVAAVRREEPVPADAGVLLERDHVAQAGVQEVLDGGDAGGPGPDHADAGHLIVP
jgi:hypothetical protein